MIVEVLDMDPKAQKNKLDIKENPNQGIYVKDCTKRLCSSVNELEIALLDGNKNKHVGETMMNRDSSRSHCIFTVYIETSETIQVNKLSYNLQEWPVENKNGKAQFSRFGRFRKIKKDSSIGLEAQRSYQN